MFIKKQALNEINSKLKTLDQKLNGYTDYSYKYSDFLNDYITKETYIPGLIEEVNKLKAIVAELVNHVYSEEK